MKKKNFKWRIFTSPTVFSVMTEKKCNILDSILNKCLDSGIDTITYEDIYYINIKFMNGVKSRFWNANKFYGWIQDGNIGGFVWGKCRPSRSTMRRLDFHINEYHKNNWA